MSLSAETMRKLVELGLPKENLLEAIEAIEADGASGRTKGAERQARYRERKAKRNESNVTRDVTCDGHSDAKETPPTPPKENTPPSPPKGGHIPPVTPDDLEAIERAYHPAGLVNSNPQALLVPIGRAAVRLGGMPALLTAMRSYTKAVRDEDSKPVGLRKFLDPAEGFLDRLAKPAAGSDDGHWQARLAQFAKDGFWSRSWGAKPGSPGCKAPADLIRQTLKESA